MPLEYCDLYAATMSDEIFVTRPTTVPWKKRDKEEAIRAVRKLINSKAKTCKFFSNRSKYVFPIQSSIVLEKFNQMIEFLYFSLFSVSLPSFSDEFILRFLCARKINVEETFQLIVNYSDFRRNNPALFEQLSVKDESVQNCLHDGLPSVLKNRDR